MGIHSQSRREFLRTLKFSAQPSGLVDDPLFEKYARKTLGPRVYSNALINNDIRDTENAARVGNVTSGLTPYSGTWGISEVLHLLRRTGYGHKKNHGDTLLALNTSDAVDAVLNINAVPSSPPINWYNNITADENAVPYGADWTNDAFSTNSIGQTTNVNRKEGLRRWLLGLGCNQDISIREKMMMFWYHFIPVDFEAVYQSSNNYASTNSARICYTYMKLFRDYATGNFRALIREVATHPAMMFYLNNQANSSTAPDENFARELMELFTLGKDPLSQYTQDDVIAAAKVLTGWRVQNLNLNTTATNFVSGSHSAGSKQFSSFFNNTVIPGTGATELDALLDMIFSKSKVVSEYICRRLYRFFVYYDIDSNVETNVIVPLAQALVANNWNMLPVLKLLFKSEHFFDMANRGVCIKSPFDIVIGTLRSFNLNYNVADATNYEAQYKVWSYFNNTICLQMEQQFGAVPTVSGWTAYYQSPAFHEYWINTNTVQKRFSYLQKIFDGFNLNYNSLTTRIQVDYIAFVQQFPNSTCQDPNLLVAECIKWLLPIDLSTSQKNSIKQQTLLYQQITDSYWTSAWNNYISNPANSSYKAIVNDRLKGLLYTIVQLSEFQLM